jgi:uridine phosphorylase
MHKELQRTAVSYRRQSMMTNPDKPLPFLITRPRDLASRTLVVGDPGRAALAAELLPNAEEVGGFGEYKTFTGEFAAKRVTISSYGIGGAGASLCFEGLIQGAVKTIIRAGTCGAMRKSIKDGELIIGTGAIREDGTSERLMPIAYPAIADRHVISALEAAAAAQGYTRLHEGIILTQSYFYPGILPPAVDTWLEADVDVCAVEMELATLLIMASLHGVRAGGIFTSDGNMTEEADMTEYDPHRSVVEEGVSTMLKIALDALARLA